MSGEFDFIDWIRAQPLAGDLVRLGPGDDLAALHWQAGDLLLAGMDQALDGVHFDSAIHSPRQVGRKVMNRNLSDCAAMAALPVAALAAVALPKGMSLAAAQELYLGLRDAADPFGCPIVGGDTASWPGKLQITVAILARSAGIAPITRSGARSGDGIYVTGPLGGSILGRHMTFTPCVQLGRELGVCGCVTAMIDLSDGLSRDLGQICAQSRVGAVVDAAMVPIHGDAVTLGGRDGRSALEHALHDGEDYELLFTAHGQPPAGTRIGIVTAEPGVVLEDQSGRRALEPLGWEHRL